MRSLFANILERGVRGAARESVKCSSSAASVRKHGCWNNPLARPVSLGWNPVSFFAGVSFRDGRGGVSWTQCPPHPKKKSYCKVRYKGVRVGGGHYSCSDMGRKTIQSGCAMGVKRQKGGRRGGGWGVKIHGQGRARISSGGLYVLRYKGGAKINLERGFNRDKTSYSCLGGGEKHTWLLESSMNRKDIHIIRTLSQLIKKESNINKNPIKGHKIFTNVSTVFKNKRRKGCSSVRRM